MQEARRRCLTHLVGAIATILPFQTESTEEEEDGHTIMSEERDDMNGEERINIGRALRQPVHIMLKILIFVLFDHRAEPVAIVMQEDAYDSKAPEGITLRARQQIIIHG